MENTSNKGRTFWDLLSTIPKTIIWIAVIFIILLIVFLIFNRYSIKTPLLEIAPPKSAIKDSLLHETKSIETKKKEISNGIHSGNSTNIKAGDGEQYNIQGNSGLIVNGDNEGVIVGGDNNGIIAQNSTINVNTDLPPRNLKSEDVKEDLISVINKVMRDNKRDKLCPIRIRVDYSSEEAIDYANEIYYYLKSLKYNLISNVHHEIFAPQLYQTGVFYEKAEVYGDTANVVQIKVGLNKPLKKN